MTRSLKSMQRAATIPVSSTPRLPFFEPFASLDALDLHGHPAKSSPSVAPNPRLDPILTRRPRVSPNRSRSESPSTPGYSPTPAVEALDLHEYDYEAESELRKLNRLTQHATGSKTDLLTLRGRYEDISRSRRYPANVRLQASLRLHLLKGYLDGGARRANVPTDPNDAAAAVYRQFTAINWEPMHGYFKNCRTSLEVYNAHLDDQRYFVNFGTDKHLVNARGEVGSTGFDSYVNLVETGSTSRFATLQGQGPKTDGQRTRYVSAAAHYAKKTGCSEVFFINCATDKGQITNFSDFVQAFPTPQGQTLHYLEVDGWLDSTLPDDFTHITSSVDQLVEQVEKVDAKTLLVFNCHAGMDRSGIANALTQLRLCHPNPSDPDAAVSQVVGRIKAGRPFAIAAMRRFHYIKRLYAFMRGVKAPLEASMALPQHVNGEMAP